MVVIQQNKSTWLDDLRTQRSMLLNTVTFQIFNVWSVWSWEHPRQSMTLYNEQHLWFMLAFFGLEFNSAFVWITLITTRIPIEKEGSKKKKVKLTKRKSEREDPPWEHQTPSAFASESQMACLVYLFKYCIKLSSMSSWGMNKEKRRRESLSIILAPGGCYQPTVKAVSFSSKWERVPFKHFNTWQKS